MNQATITPENLKSEYSGKKFDKPVITHKIIPVEIFILFLTKSSESFTVNDVIKYFDIIYKINLSFERVQIILNDLVLSHKLKKEKGINRFNRSVNYYSFNKLT